MRFDHRSFSLLMSVSFTLYVSLLNTHRHTQLNETQEKLNQISVFPSHHAVNTLVPLFYKAIDMHTRFHLCFIWNSNRRRKERSKSQVLAKVYSICNFVCKPKRQCLLILSLINHINQNTSLEYTKHILNSMLPCVWRASFIHFQRHVITGFIYKFRFWINNCPFIHSDWLVWLFERRA